MKIVIARSMADTFTRFCAGNDMIGINGARVGELTIIYNVDMPDFVELPFYAMKVGENV